MRVLWLVVAAVAVAVLARMSYFTVDRAEYAYVTLFGQHVATYDGATEAGLHWRWPAPVQSVERLDRRLQVFDLPATEQLTRDPGGQTIDRTLTVEGYVCWRIADAGGVDRFIRTVGTADQAQVILSQQISSQLSAEIGKMRMDEFVSDTPHQVDEAMTGLRRRLLTRFRGDGAAGQSAGGGNEYGIEVVDIRLRRYNYPVQVRPDIAQRIISERNKKKAKYEGEATVKVGKINADSDRECREIRARAEARAREIKGEADADADRIRNEAFSKDVDFYVFLKKLEEYQNILGNNRSVLLLSSHRELFDLLFAPPKLQGGTGKGGTGIARPGSGTKSAVSSRAPGH